MICGVRGAVLPMLQQIQPWLPRLLTLLQWLFGLAIAYVIASTGLVLMGESDGEPKSTGEAIRAVNSTNSMPPAPSLNSLIQQDWLAPCGLR